MVEEHYILLSLKFISEILSLYFILFLLQILIFQERIFHLWTFLLCIQHPVFAAHYLLLWENQLWFCCIFSRLFPQSLCFFFPPVCFGFFHFRHFSKIPTDLCLIIHISKCGTKVILGMWWGRKPTAMRTFPTLNRDTCRHYFSWAELVISSKQNLQSPAGTYKTASHSSGVSGRGWGLKLPLSIGQSLLHPFDSSKGSLSPPTFFCSPCDHRADLHRPWSPQITWRNLSRS